MISAKIEYTCDRTSKNGDNQRGRIMVQTATGVIKATWSSTGGSGDGAVLVSNTTKEFNEEDAEKLLDSADLCQGIGDYTADIDQDEFGWYSLTNIVWV